MSEFSKLNIFRFHKQNFSQSGTQSYDNPFCSPWSGLHQISGWNRSNGSLKCSWLYETEVQTFISYHYIEFHWELYSQNTTFSFYVSVSPMRTYTNLGQQEDTYSHIFTVLYIKTINKQNQILLREFFAIDINDKFSKAHQ